MHIKKKNVARLASLSALGAGALGVAAGTAQAAVVNPAVAVGFAGGVASWTVALPGTWSGAQGHLNVLGTYAANRQSVRVVATAHALFQRVGGILKIASSGNTFSGARAKGTNVGVSAIIAGRHLSVGVTSGFAFGAGYPVGNFNLEYALFTFQSSLATTPTNTAYGWLELSSSVRAANTLGTGFGSNAPQVTVLAYNFSLNGPIESGDPDGIHGGCTGDDENEGDDTGGCAVPEPSSMAMFGLAALAWGATGLRRWRASRNPAA